jgi:hypothetical protein
MRKEEFRSSGVQEFKEFKEFRSSRSSKEQFFGLARHFLIT